MNKLITETVEIIAAHISHNAVPASELPGLIRNVHRSLLEIVDGVKTEVIVERAVEPAVPIRKSVHRDYLISLEDGKKYQTLRRHLLGRGMTPEDYRAKWGLPADYPMVAAAYSERRSTMAKSLGFGRKAAVEVVEPQSKPKRSRSKAKGQPVAAVEQALVEDANEATKSVEPLANTSPAEPLRQIEPAMS
jgi:predicted transcriptional regulator